MVLVLAQRGAPGVQTWRTHAPPLQAKPLSQPPGVHARPSTSQVSRIVGAPVTQRVAPGVQMRARQVPSRQLSLEPQGTVLEPCPSALQTVRALAETHARPTPGTQVKGWQAPLAVLHPWPLGHAVAAA